MHYPKLDAQEYRRVPRQAFCRPVRLFVEFDVPLAAAGWPRAKPCDEDSHDARKSQSFALAPNYTASFFSTVRIYSISSLPGEQSSHLRRWAERVPQTVSLVRVNRSPLGLCTPWVAEITGFPEWVARTCYVGPRSVMKERGDPRTLESRCALAGPLSYRIDWLGTIPDDRPPGPVI